jgi:LysM repeat protein
MEMDETGSKISRVLTVIFLIHIVIIGLIYFHQKYMADRPDVAGGANRIENLAAASAAESERNELPQLSSGEKPYIVKLGDNYEKIAANLQVDEQDLRVLNKHADISQGLILCIPPKRIVAEDPPEVAALRALVPANEDSGMVEAVDVSHAPKAQLVQINASRNSSSSPSDSPRSFVPVTDAANLPTGASGKTYVVKKGDSIFRIASHYKVDQKALMRVNSITDPRKMKIGMKLMIPAN